MQKQKTTTVILKVFQGMAKDGKGEERSDRRETDVGGICCEHAQNHHREHHLIVKLRITTNCKSKSNRSI